MALKGHRGDVVFKCRLSTCQLEFPTDAEGGFYKSAEVEAVGLVDLV